MKRFKLFFVALALSIAWVIIGAIRISGNTAPDAGFELLNYIVASVLLSGLALTLDLFFIFAGPVNISKRPFVQKRRTFWRIIGGLVVAGMLYGCFALAVT
ncbi:MAG: hypothetical protein JWL89_258 [Candidatus Saccharibacteria bacterium]|nr:hypothetical protein [Candidatus Saccharibacteria bacterium]